MTAATDANGKAKKTVQKQTGRQPAESAPSSRVAPRQFAIEMEDFSWQWAQVTLVGDTPLLTNAFSQSKLDVMEKALVKPAIKQSSKATKKARDPAAEFRQATHICEGGYSEPVFDGSLFGFPAVGLKKAFARAAHEFAGAVMKDMIRFTFFHGEYNGLVPIHAVGNPEKAVIPTMKRDAVPNNKGQCTLVYRPEFYPWSMTVAVRFCDAKLRLEDVINVLRAAGQICGIGSFRHENGGIYGLWQLDQKIVMLPDDYQPKITPVLLKK